MPPCIASSMWHALQPPHQHADVSTGADSCLAVEEGRKLDEVDVHRETDQCAQKQDDADCAEGHPQQAAEGAQPPLLDCARPWNALSRVVNSLQ